MGKPVPIAEKPAFDAAISAVAPWYGSNRLLSESVGKLMGRQSWIGVPFAGGLCELPYLEGRTLVASDKHRHIINLARVIGDEKLKDEFVESIEGRLFHADEISQAQRYCRDIELQSAGAGLFPGDRSVDPDTANVEWACNYWVAVWMARSGNAGTPSEFSGGLSLRWEAGGGDSVARYRNAVAGVDAWHDVLKHWTFNVMDVFEFLNKCKDEYGIGIYLDPPFPDAGDSYSHPFDYRKQKQLIDRVHEFKRAKVLMRYHEHELVAELFSTSPWHRVVLRGRAQTNEDRAEWYFCNKEIPG